MAKILCSGQRYWPRHVLLHTGTACAILRKNNFWARLPVATVRVKYDKDTVFWTEILAPSRVATHRDRVYFKKKLISGLDYP